MRFKLSLIAFVAVLGIVSAELFARFELGLGTPPLSVSDPEVEYMFKPSQDVWRFGNHLIFNEYGMRSDPIPSEKPAGEFRILAMGDSVINGGSQTDHDDLATSILSTGHIRVLNASAGSWGPPNILAYIEKFGLFEADMLVVVLSSHDAGDVPTFAPLNPNTHPTRKPLLALTEGVMRYLPRYLPLFGSSEKSGSSAKPQESNRSDPQALNAVTALANLPIPVCFVMHPTRNEFDSKSWESGYAAIVDAAGHADIVDQMEFIQSSKDYRDGIHASSEGQKALAKAISACM